MSTLASSKAASNGWSRRQEDRQAELEAIERSFSVVDEGSIDAPAEEAPTPWAGFWALLIIALMDDVRAEFGAVQYMVVEACRVRADASMH